MFAAAFDAPVVFYCQNNQWAISEPVERQSRVPLCERARGYGFPGVRVDGNDVLACLAVTRWALEECRTGNGPVMIEAFTYRMDAHTTSDDPTRYRMADEEEHWKLLDPIERVRVHLSAAGRRPGVLRRGRGRGRRAGRPVPGALRGHAKARPGRIFAHVYTERTPQLDAQREAYPGVPRRLRRGEDGDRRWPRSLTLAKALNTGLRAAMEGDPKVLVMGEDVGKLGGVFRVTDGLQKDFGEHRVLDTPLAESGIIGTAVGLAMRGYRPVCEIQFDGFVFPGFDQIISQVAKITTGRRAWCDADGDPDPVRRRHRRGRAPRRVAGVVLLPHRRAAGGRLLEPAGRLRHDPAGHRLRRPGDLLRAEAAVLGEGRGGPGAREPPPAVQLARCVRPGTDVTVVGYGPVGADLPGGGRRGRGRGPTLEVIDLRTLSPLDLDPVVESVRRTGRLVVVSEAPLEIVDDLRHRGPGAGACFYSLAAPVLRVAGFDTPYPPARCEEEYLPDLDKVLDAVDRSLAW